MNRLTPHLAKTLIPLALLLLGAEAQAQQVVLDFEDLTGFAPMPAGYGGIANWGSWAHSDLTDPNYPAYGGSVKILSVGVQQTIQFGQPYIFDGARVVTALPFSFELFHQGVLVHTTAVLQPNTGGPAAWLPSGYSGLVDSMRYVSSVNVHGVDLFTYTIPNPAPVAYCTAGTSSSGCVPQISASAHPSATLASPCVIDVANVEGQKSGLLFYGIDNSGFTPLAWGTGSTSYLCVKPPTQRMTVQLSGGTVGQCDGALSQDWNAFQTAFPAALGNPFAVGQKVHVQAWYRDPPAPRTTNLSDAVELTVAW